MRELAIRDIAAVQEFVAVDNALNGVVQEGSTDVIHAAQHLHRALARMAVDALLEMTDILSGTMDEATWLQAADSRLSDAYRDLNTYQAAINRHLNRLL
ncbi:hypothetical protein ACFW6F_22030 [Streptomyces sp. NPDC058746]|uniref:hypothetical protein n=1 Tax=Streptomyces sp. NPDC058746 TaxID=3346622 RepID=UPI0036CEC7D4